MESNEVYQKFTAIGKIIDDEPYQVIMSNNFKPFHRNVSYFDAKHVDIKLLISSLTFIKNKQFWEQTFRYGFLKIDQNSFKIIAQNMLKQSEIY